MRGIFIRAGWISAHGGFLAPNIYYLGVAGVVQVNGLRIAGASGIYGRHDYRLGMLKLCIASGPLTNTLMRRVLRETSVRQVVYAQHLSYSRVYYEQAAGGGSPSTTAQIRPPLTSPCRFNRPTYFYLTTGLSTSNCTVILRPFSKRSPISKGVLTRENWGLPL